jgi:hypothetical protein
MVLERTAAKRLARVRRQGPMVDEHCCVLTSATGARNGSRGLSAMGPRLNLNLDHHAVP